MAVSTFIITISDFQNRATISKNLNTNRLKDSIAIVQEQFAIKILCREFYEDVLEVVAGTTTNADITTLLPYIKDFLVQKTYERYLVGSNTQVTPGGVRTPIDDEVSNVANDAQMGRLIAQAKSDSSFYQDQLVNFLSLNEDTYTVWRDSDCGCGKGRRSVANNQFAVAGKTNRKERIEYT